jgi:hypothetical protein
MKRPSFVLGRFALAKLMLLCRVMNRNCPEIPSPEGRLPVLGFMVGLHRVQECLSLELWLRLLLVLCTYPEPGGNILAAR